MRSRTAVLRTGLFLASGIFALHSAAADLFVAPGDTGKARIAIKNLQEVPVLGVRIQDISDARLEVGAGSTGPQDIPGGGTKFFDIHYTIRPDAPEGSADLPVFPAAGGELTLSPASQPFRFSVDATKPVVGFAGADGEPLLDEAGLPVVSGAVIKTRTLRISGADAGGAGIGLFTLAGPTPFLPVEFTGEADGRVRYDELVNGDYVASVFDRALNISSITFTVQADQNVPTLTVRKPSGEIIPDGGVHDATTVLIDAADNTGDDPSGVAKITIIGLDPHNDFENFVDYDAAPTVSFSTNLPLGVYWIIATDTEGNFREQTFELQSTTGPLATVQLSGVDVYNEFRGLSISSPSAIAVLIDGYDPVTARPALSADLFYRARAIVVGAGRGSPITQVRVTGPGNFEAVNDFSPPALDIPTAHAGRVSPGVYQMTIEDEGAGKTFMPFKVVELSAYRCPGVESVYIDTGTFAVADHICLASSLGLKSIQEVTRYQVNVGPETLISSNAFVPQSAVTATRFSNERFYSVTDVESNAAGFVADTVVQDYALASAQVLLGEGAASVASEPLNLDSFPVLNGARLVGGVGGSTAPASLASIAVNSAMVNNLPISNSPVVIGSLVVSLDGATIVSGNITMSSMGVVTDPKFSGTRLVSRNPVLSATITGEVPGTVFPGNCSELASPTMCATGTVPVADKLYGVAGRIMGVFARVDFNSAYSHTVSGGPPKVLSFGSGVAIELPDHGPGAITLSITSRPPPLRYKGLPAQVTYRIRSGVTLTNTAKISLPYSTADLTPEQQQKITILESTRLNPGPEDFLPIPSEIVNGKIVGTTSNLKSEFGVEFMVVTPIHPGACVAGSIDLLFQSDRCDVVIQPEGATSFGLRKTLAVLSARGILPVTDIFHVGPDGASFPRSGVVEMRVDESRLNALDIVRSTLRIIQFNEQGATVMPSQSAGTERFAAKVPKLTSNFAVFGDGAPVLVDLSPPVSSLSFSREHGTDGSGRRLIDTRTEIDLLASDPVLPNYLTSGVASRHILVDEAFVDAAATPGALFSSTFTLSTGTHSLAFYSVDNSGNIGAASFASVLVSLPDALPPRTDFAVGLPSATLSGVTFVSGASALGFSVVDDDKIVGDGLGVGATQTFYAIDGAAYAAYAGTFTLALEGTHAVSFYSVDLEGNAEAPRQREAFVDLTPPVTQLNQNGAEISLDAFDPSAAGGASGVGRIRYLVDYLNPDVCDNVAEDTAAARGTCENPWYAGPFALSNGGHSVRFQAFDRVGNAEPAQTAFPNVGPSGGGGDDGGLAIGRDPFNAFWTVNAEPDGVAFTRSDSSGAPLATSSLEDGVNDMPWSVFFDASGRAYAVGMAEGPGTQALDLAIYKASPSGDTIESRTLSDAGYASNELVFDAKSPGWIVGAAQSAGPVDFEADGERSLSLALWRYDPASGAVELTTSASRAGFDFGTGLAVDADGSLWVVGYSARPDAPEDGGLDLALRHYASDGRTLLGGPFHKPGYASNLDGGITAKVHLTGDAVYVAAPRINGADGFDLAFLKFDKVTGQTLVEKVWRAADGSSSQPAAILPEAAGLLIAGKIGGDMTDAGLWRFGFDGAFLSAATADAGGARGAVFKGSELWLSVDGSTSPYRVLSEEPAAGALIDISTPPAPAGFAVNPATGPIGIPFTVTGTGFGPYSGSNTRIKFGTLAAPVSVWNDTTIKGTIPGLSTGVYAATIERQNASSVTVVSAGDFTVTDLNTAVLNVSSGPIGVPFTIAGTGFGPYAGTLSRVLVDGATAALSVWNDTTISGTIPGVEPGAKAMVIQRAVGAFLSTSDGFAFEVTVPSVTAVSPSSGPIGAAYTLTGFSFGPYAGANTRVLMGGATTALSLWSDRVIKGTVPGVLAPGVQTVIVERLTAGGGLVRSGTAYFQVAGLAFTGIAPSSAPIGVPFTVSGSGFGVFDGANTRVRFGVSTAALSLWNDTTITGTIPALEAGEWPVVVERQQGSAVSVSATATFTATALSVSSISPSSGPIGTAFTLSGPGFGPYAGSASSVLIDGATAALSVWNDAQIVGTIPGSAATGTRPVVLRRTSGTGESVSTPVFFEVTGPAVTGIVPSSAPIGAPFTITGANFGAYAGANTRVTFNGVIAALSLWNDTTITGTVPSVPAGIVDVVVERQQGTAVAASAAAPFTVLDPAVGGVSPGSGPIGTSFTITGSGFGPYAGTNTRVLIGGATTALSLWNDTTIKGTVPALPPGVKPVWLERSAGSGVSSSATSYFDITTPAVTALTPSSAPIGAPFSITGTSFGAYAGANTRVTINGVNAPLSVWNDTQINGTVPGSLPPGAATLVVERTAGTGLAASATQAFLVLAPSISTISPAYGPAGTVVTVNGSGFGPYAGGATRLLIGGATVPLSVWSDTTIRWTVPASLGDGEYPVVVERSPAGGTVASASATFTVGTGYGGASFGFTETLSLAATPDSHFEGDMSLSSAAGGRIDTPAKAAVEIPPNAMEEDTAITLKRIRSDGLRAAAAEEIKMRPAGEPIEFGPPGTRFATPVTIELPYDPALIADESKIAIHYYNPLRREWEELASVVDRARKVVTAKTDHFSIYQPLGLAPATAAQDEFYFRDAYAFPNPSRGGTLVTFRIQPGLAETVELRVYDVSGRKIHSSSDFTFRGAVDDGNGKGAQNTYDHGWSVGGVASGVYHFVIKASRSGHKPITKSGKVGVIR